MCTCELDVELVFWLEDLDVQWAVGGKVLYGPGPKDGLVVLGGEVIADTSPVRTAGVGVGVRAAALTAAVRSTSFRLLSRKQASPLSIL